MRERGDVIIYERFRSGKVFEQHGSCGMFISAPFAQEQNRMFDCEFGEECIYADFRNINICSTPRDKREGLPNLPFTLSSDLPDIDIGRGDFSLSLRLCMQNKGLDMPNVFHVHLQFSSGFLPRVSFFFFVLFVFVRVVCVCGVDNIVIVRYTDSINPRLLRFMSIVSTACIATRKYSLQKNGTCHNAFDIFLIYICPCNMQTTFL